MIPDPSPGMSGIFICSECDFKPEGIKKHFQERDALLKKMADVMGEKYPSPPSFDSDFWGGKKPELILEPKEEMNPYLADVFSLVDGNEYAIRDQMLMSASKYLMPLSIGRHRYVYKYAWAIPCKAALEAIAKHSPIVEVGAGSGYWASLLSKVGVDIIAYDIAPENVHLSKKHHRWKWFDVKKGDEKSVAAHSDRALFLCWPPYNEDMAFNCAKQYKGDVILFIGERNGCTGTEEFFDYLDEHFELEDSIELPVWLGLHDALYIYRHKKS